MKYILLLLVQFTVQSHILGQDDYDFMIIRDKTPISIDEATLSNCEELSDIINQYPSDWVDTYHKVTYDVTIDGQKQRFEVSNDKLSKEIIEAILKHDIGTTTSISINYTPKNTLDDNPPRILDYKLTIDPLKEASFPGGRASIRNYVSKRLEPLDISVIHQYQIGAIQFSVSERGTIYDAIIHTSTGNAELDSDLLKIICEMPQWSAAQYLRGTAVSQHFYFTVGDMNSCMMNTLKLQ